MGYGVFIEQAVCTGDDHNLVGRFVYATVDGLVHAAAGVGDDLSVEGVVGLMRSGYFRYCL